MSLDRVIGYLMGGDLLATRIQIANNIGDSVPPRPGPGTGTGTGTGTGASTGPSTAPGMGVMAEPSSSAALPSTPLPPKLTAFPADPAAADLAVLEPSVEAGASTGATAGSGVRTADLVAQAKAEFARMMLADAGPAASASLLGLRPPRDEGARTLSALAAGEAGEPGSGLAATRSGTSTILPADALLARLTLEEDADTLVNPELAGAMLAGSGQRTGTRALREAMANAAGVTQEADAALEPGSAGERAALLAAERVRGDQARLEQVRHDAVNGAGPAGEADPDGPDAARQTAGSNAAGSSAGGPALAQSASGRAALEAVLRDPSAFAGALAGVTAGLAQTERAGIIASFVLNAAMIPGWPPPRPLEAAGLDAQKAVRQLQAGMDETEAANYLATLGVPGGLMARLAAFAEALAQRARLWFGLLVLLSSALAVLASLKEDEDEPDADDLLADEFMGPDGRARLILR